jgi:large subunit ribosomal protein L24
MGARGFKKLKAMRRAEFKHSTPAIRRDDKVQVIAGDEKGKVGRVLRVLVSRERVVVEGVNMIFRHMKRSQQNPQGGRVEREGTIHVSNVLLYCEKCSKGGRVRMQVEDGKKTRVCAKCGGKAG